MIEGFNACCEEAGTKVTGGQTVFNPWPLLGGCAMATVPQSQLVRTDLAVPGNVIVLTKPLGTQITGNLALWMMNQGQWAKVVDAGLDTETCTRAVKTGDLSMMTLNKNGCKYMREFGALGATDVTGFGLLGHADNLARVQKSGASIEIDTIPVIRGCKTLSTARPNGRDYGLFEGRASETSGGLLVMLKDEETAAKFVKALRSCYGDDDPRREWGWIVGRVVETKNGDKQGASILPDHKAYIDKIVEDPNLKFIFVGGKGGVGKTTTSSAIAMQLAYTRKVLLLSTDPAHSLGDAFRTRFGGEPTPVPGVPNLDVLEINPHTYLAEELYQWGQLANQAGYNDLIDNVEKLQDWISGIPGIDEATALSSVVDLLEGGHYDIIVFDTAPTGHTLKLLQLPDILQVGLTKLESWQTSLWQYWQMVKGGNYSQTEALRKKVTSRIRDYKKGIEKVGRMLKDRMRTTFVVVCIAEYLSIKESQRLLRELHKDQVAVSHVVVNQLVLGDFTTLPIDDATIARKGEEALGQAQWSIVADALQFCRARNSIQQKYLSELCNFPEVADANLSVIQLPLLPYEVTGVPNLLNFSQMLLPDGYRKGSNPKPLVDRVSVPQELYGDSRSFMDGDRVVVTGLVKAQHYNGKPAEVIKVTDDGRVAVRVEVEPNKFKMLSLKQDNLKLADDDEQQQEDEEELQSKSPRFI
ncbi:hypothetical protein FOZ62_022659 [Perkinsus olseni]|uniref:Uncharacterized protein n=1 Tax=Perkinsus olseni TaxID=32597 RepID=A0A7J6SNY3_PEROL|nr:hypothetical protein FOZ62_022659 [Perkinsus olseni]